ncbi:MAG: restriction endonuclease subunit S [Bacteroidaceae bacterium]|nr:restriction endonuclease subunit S [Bacteroidaceae bacterium]
MYDLKYGTSKKSSESGSVPVLRMGNLTRKGTISYDNLVYSSDSSDIEEYELTTGDLLFNRTNSSEWVGKTALYDGKVKSIYAGYLIRVRTIIINSEYLNIVMNSQYYRNWCYSVKTDAVNQSNINANKLASLLVPIPPISEQNQIVQEVTKMTEFIDLIEQGESDLQSIIGNIKSKILELAIHGKLVPQDANDEPASELLKRINPKAVASCDNPHYANIPSSWVCTTMGSIFQHNTGKALNKSASTEGTLLPYLTTSNVYWNTFDLSVVKEMRFKESEIEKCTIINGDLLVCEGGDIGRSAIWDKDYSICIQNHLHRLRPKGDVVPLLYLYYIMYLKITNNLQGKGIGLQGFSSGLLDKLEVPLPPYNEQIRIVDKIQETFNMLDSIAESLN